MQWFSTYTAMPLNFSTVFINLKGVGLMERSSKEQEKGRGKGGGYLMKCGSFSILETIMLFHFFF